MSEPEMISLDEAMRLLRERLEQGPPTTVPDDYEDESEVCSGCGADFRDVSNYYGHQSEGDCRVFMDRNGLWSRPLVMTYERARRFVFFKTAIWDHPLLTRVFNAVDRPVERVVWEIQHHYLMHTLKGIALEDYRVYVEDYEHWMSGSWESYMEERGYL